MPMTQQRFSFIPETAGAVLSDDRVYRYALYRSLDNEPWSAVVNGKGALRRTLLFVLLNPSTADEWTNDPTILKCLKYAGAWGYDRLAVGNVYAYREADSKKIPKLRAAGVDLVGRDNDRHLMVLSALAERTICGWGNHGLEHTDRVRALLQGRVECFSLNSNGTPVHPLYQRDDAQPKHFWTGQP